MVVTEYEIKYFKYLKPKMYWAIFNYAVKVERARVLNHIGFAELHDAPLWAVSQAVKSGEDL